MSPSGHSTVLIGPCPSIQNPVELNDLPSKKVHQDTYSMSCSMMECESSAQVGYAGEVDLSNVGRRHLRSAGYNNPDPGSCEEVNMIK